MSFKSKIKKSFIGRYLISELHCVESVIVPKLISDEKAVKKYYYKKTGKKLNLDAPATYSEKMNWLKLNNRDPLMEKCADKVEVRDYVKSKGYADLLNDVIAVYDKAKDINIDSLPEKFVLKAAHGSHMNIIVNGNKKDINWRQNKKMMSSWLRQNIYWSGREWVYKDLKKRIVAEKYLEDESGELRDYKFFCFNGVPSYMQYDGNRYSGKHYRNYYDLNKNLLDIDDDIGKNSNVPFPLSQDDLDKMLKIAADLSEPFQQVRVDFYLVNGKVYFGELTYFHNGGVTYFTDEWDKKFAENWSIVKG